MMRRTELSRRAPLRNKAPMKQGGWIKRQGNKREGPGLAQRIAQAVGLALGHLPKESTMWRSRQHRMNVAAMPCACCGRLGRSQAAHLNLLALGKGKGLKVSDALLVPLCAPELGKPGCHWMLDQGAIYDKATSASIQVEWLQRTRTDMQRLRLWPEQAEADMQRLVGAYLQRGNP